MRFHRQGNTVTLSMRRFLYLHFVFLVVSSRWVLVVEANPVGKFLMRLDDRRKEVGQKLLMNLNSDRRKARGATMKQEDTEDKETGCLSPEVFMSFEQEKGELQREKNELLASNRDLTEKLEQAVNEQRRVLQLEEGVESACEAVTKKWKADYQALLEEKNALKKSSAEAIQKWKADYTQLEESMENRLAELSASSERGVEEILNKAQAELNSTKQACYEMEETNAKQIAQVKTTCDESLERQKHDIQLEMKLLLEKLKGEHEKIREDLTKQNEELAARLKEMELKHTIASKDAAFWETSFHRRSYLNLTQLSGDLLFAADAAQKATSEKLGIVTATSIEKSKEMYNKAGKAAAPYLDKSREMYDANLKRHVDVAVEKTLPVYNAHIASKVEKARGIASNFKTKSKEAAKAGFLELSAQYATICRASLSTLKTHKNVSDGVIGFVEKACQDAEKSVAFFVKFSVLVLVLVFRRNICRLFAGIVSSTFSIVWFFSPFRLFFSRKSKKEPETNGVHRKPQNGR